jgi:hypothetical protein
MTGVTGLACAVCGQVVGAINVEALERMLDTDDIYICARCEARDDIEDVLGAQLPDHYAHIVGRVMIDQILAREPLAVAVHQ